MSEVFKSIGKIENIEIKTGEGAKGPWKRATFTIDGKKYGTFDKDIINDFKVGQLVSFEFEKDGIYSNITDMYTANAAEREGQSIGILSQHSFIPSSSNKDKLIVRQSCLKAAVDASLPFKHEGDTAESMSIWILKTAEEFEKWVWRE